MKMHNVMVKMLVTALPAVLVAQQSAPPPPKPADNGPSLAVTMQFIQDKLNDIGTITYVTTSHYKDQTFTNVNHLTITNVIADPKACRISYRRGWGTDIENLALPFGEVRDVVLNLTSST